MEGSGSCGWGGRGFGDEEERRGGGVPSEIDHLLSPLRSFSSVAVSKQLHYVADQIKKTKKTAAHNNMVEHYFNV